jgi:cation:H+ antiporter
LDASLLHFPLIAMLGSLALVIILASFRGYLNKTAAFILLAAYPLFLITLLIA